MFFRVLALLIVVVWLGMTIAGNAGDDPDNYGQPSIFTADNQDAGDDSFKIFHVVFLASTFHLGPSIIVVNDRVGPRFTVHDEFAKPLTLNCTLLL